MNPTPLAAPEDVNASQPAAYIAPPSVTYTQPSWAANTASANPIAIPSTIPNAAMTGNVSPVTVPQTGMATATSALNNLAGTVMQQSQAPAAPLSERDQSIKDRQAAIDLYTNPTSGYTAKSNQYQNDAQLSQKTNELSQLDVKDLALQKTQRDMENAILNKNASGMSSFGGQALISQNARDISSQRADLAIQKLALQGDVKLASDLITKKLDAEFEPIKQRIDYIDKSLALYNNDLSDSQKQKLELEKYQLTEKSKGLDDFTKYTKEAIGNGAPVELTNQAVNMYKAGDVNGATALLTKYTKGTLEDSSGNVQGVTVPISGEYSDALNNILGSSKLTKEQKNDLISAVNSGKDPSTIIKNQAKQILGTADAKDLRNYEQAKDTLTTLQSNLAEFYKEGGDTGLFKGNFEKAINRLGEVNDPKLVGIATQIAQQLQLYRNAVSGTAYSVQEGQQIADVFPGINKSQGLNDAIIKGRLAAFDSTIDSAYSNALGDDVYAQIKKADQMKPTPIEKTAIEKMKADGKTPEQIQAIIGRPISGLTNVGSDTKQASNGKEVVGNYDITSYATDPTHGVKVQKIYSSIPEVSNPQDIDVYISKIAPGSPVKGQDVLAASTKYGVDPKLVLALMVQDSTLGTRGLAVRTKNPGNVGNTDSGATKTFTDWSEGVDAVAANLAWRKINKSKA